MNFLAELHFLTFMVLCGVLLVVCLLVCIALLVLVFGGGVLLWMHLERRFTERQGYWVDYVSGRGDSDKYGTIYLLTYHEGHNSKVFEGRKNHRGSELLVPEDHLLPDWLKGRRDIVVQRLQRHSKWTQVVTKITPVADD